MSKELPRVSHDITPVDLADLFDEFGGVIIENIISDNLLAQIHKEVQPILNTTPLGNDEFEGTSTKRTGGLVGRSAGIRELVRNPLVLGLCTEIFGKDGGFQLNQAQLIAIGSGETAQPVHRDQWLYNFFPFPPGYEAIIQTMWALTPFTEENGATRYVPGSHRIPEQTEIIREGKRFRTEYAMNSSSETIRFHFEDTKPILMEAGSMVMWSGQLYHGGGNNTSDRTRWGMNIGYTRGWIRQEENQYLSISPEVQAELDDDFLRLIGWARSGYGHGYAGNMNDPLDIARGRKGHQGFGDPVLAPNKLGDV